MGAGWLAPGQSQLLQPERGELPCLEDQSGDNWTLGADDIQWDEVSGSQPCLTLSSLVSTTSVLANPVMSRPTAVLQDARHRLSP